MNFLPLKLQIAELLPLQKKFMDLKSQLELKSYDLSLFQGRAEQNEHHKVFPAMYLLCYQVTSFLWAYSHLFIFIILGVLPSLVS